MLVFWTKEHHAGIRTRSSQLARAVSPYSLLVSDLPFDQDSGDSLHLVVHTLLHTVTHIIIIVAPMQLHCPHSS